MPAPAAAQPEPAPAALAPAAPAPAPEKPKPGGVLALLRLAAGATHDPLNCLPRGSYQGQEDLCDGCRRALLVRVSGMARHLGKTESHLALLCTIRGLQEIASSQPLPLSLRQVLRPFGAPPLVAEGRYAAALGPGFAADLTEEAHEEAQQKTWDALVRRRDERRKEAGDGR